LAATYNARLQELRYVNNVCEGLLDVNKQLETKLKNKMNASDEDHIKMKFEVDGVTIGDN